MVLNALSIAGDPEHQRSDSAGECPGNELAAASRAGPGSWGAVQHLRSRGYKLVSFLFGEPFMGSFRGIAFGRP